MFRKVDAYFPEAGGGGTFSIFCEHVTEIQCLLSINYTAALGFLRNMSYALK
jgi:hypothetical protein